MDYTVHGILQTRILEWVAVPFSRGSSQPRSLKLQTDSLPSELPGKPKNTGVGSLSLLQRTFRTQESNRSLLHCRWILYLLSHQGSPPHPLQQQRQQQNTIGPSRRASDLLGPGWGPSICVSNTSLRAAATADPGTTL